MQNASLASESGGVPAALALAGRGLGSAALGALGRGLLLGLRCLRLRRRRLGRDSFVPSSSGVDVGVAVADAGASADASPGTVSSTGSPGASS